MTMRITMREPMRSEDGLSVLLKGRTYFVSRQFGAAAVQSGFADDTGLALPVGASTGGGLTDSQAEAVAAAVLGEAIRVPDSYAADAWQVISVTGLVIPAPVFVKAVKLISGTSPTLVLRDSLVDTYTASSASTDVVVDLPATVIPGDEVPLNRFFRMAVHATVGGSSPVWAIKV